MMPKCAMAAASDRLRAEMGDVGLRPPRPNVALRDSLILEKQMVQMVPWRVGGTGESYILRRADMRAIIPNECSIVKVRGVVQ